MTNDIPNYGELATVVSKTPSICWVQPDLADTGRLDVDFYRGDYIAALQAIVNAPMCQVQSVGEISQRVFNFGAYSLCNLIEFVEPSATTVPFLNVGDIGDLIVHEDTKSIPGTVHHQLPKSQCQPGDVLLTMAGTIGRTAVVPAFVTKLNSNQAIAKIRLHQDYDPYFLAAFFASSYGKAQSERMAAGAVQKNLYLFNIESMFVPLPPQPVQAYIGDKVRLAERCRVRAKKLKEKAAQQFDELLGLHPLSPSQGRSASWWVTLQGFDTIRVEPAYYLPVYLTAIERLEAIGAMPLGSGLLISAKYGASVPADYGPVGIPFIRGTDLSANRIDTSDLRYLNVELAPKVKTTRVKEGDVLITRSGTVGIAAAISDQQDGFAFGSFMICLRFSQDVNPIYAAAFLNSPYVLV